jgi:Rieske Fe-S protein
MPSDEETPVQPSAVGRRTVLAGGAGLAAAVVLAGCGDDSEPGTGSTSEAPTDENSETPDAGGEEGNGGAAGGTELGAAAAVAVGGGVVFADQGVVVTQPAEGDFRAFDSACTHLTCSVTEVTDTINCVCHNSKFALEDGSVVSGPATEPLAAKEVSVADGKISLA